MLPDSSAACAVMAPNQVFTIIDSVQTGDDLSFFLLKQVLDLTGGELSAQLLYQ